MIRDDQTVYGKHASMRSRIVWFAFAILNMRIVVHDALNL